MVTKRLVFTVLLAMAVAVGCTTLYPPAPPGQGVCDQNPEAVLCKAFVYLKITPEQANDMLLDASLISIWQKWMQAADLRKAIDKVELFFNDNPTLSLNTLIKYVVQQSNVDPALALLMSRRLANFQNIPQLSDLVLDPVSRGMITKHFANQREQLSWF
jgi:hypothetical protein